MFRLRLIVLLLALGQSLWSIPKFDEGRRQIDGIVLLQDHERESDYYYLIDAPRLARGEDGNFELICIKYVGSGGAATNGGLFHALIEFSLDPERVARLQRLLEQEVPGGRIVGPVPLLETVRDGEEGMASFQVVSSILSDTEGELPLTRSIVDSGHCPLLPGSRTAIAAKLSQDGATLLWSSFQGSTSDVSVAINGYYEAVVRGYNAVVTADASTVYTHFSQVFNEQEGYRKDQLRDVTDKLIQEQTIKVEVFDRSESLDIDAGDMQGIVDLVTTKLIELMFDAKAGWAQTPNRETVVDQDQLKGRQERGAFAKFFAGTGNQKYITDNQFVLKNRKDVRVNSFYLNLSKSTTIKVPFFTTGNIRGLYDLFGEDSPYFRVVNLDDRDFSKRDILFQVDGSFAEAFGDILNFVTVSFQKTYPAGQPAVTKEVVIKGSDLVAGTDFKTITYPALGLEGEDLIDYQYRISWSFKDSDRTITLPPDPTKWLTARDGAVSLRPPFAKQLIEIDADRSRFGDAGIYSATVRFFAILNGRPQVQRTLILRADDAENTKKVALYHDERQPCAYQISWYPTQSAEPIEEDVRELRDGFLFLVPPEQ